MNKFNLSQIIRKSRKVAALVAATGAIVGAVASPQTAAAYVPQCVEYVNGHCHTYQTCTVNTGAHTWTCNYAQNPNTDGRPGVLIEWSVSGSY